MKDRSALAALLTLSALCTTAASAEWEPDGALSAFGQIEVGVEERRGGGGLLVDLWKPFGALRLGFSAGIGTLTSNNDEANRIFAPLGLSIGLASEGAVGISGALRAGGWGGATQRGLRGGAWLGGGVQLTVALDETLRLGAGAEFWLMYGQRRRTLVVPTLSLRWGLSDAE